MEADETKKACTLCSVTRDEGGRKEEEGGGGGGGGELEMRRGWEQIGQLAKCC